MDHRLVAHASAAELLEVAGAFLGNAPTPELAAVRAFVHGLACANAARPEEHGGPACVWSLADAAGEVCGAACWTPPRSLTLTDLPSAAAGAVLAGLAAHLGPSPTRPLGGFHGPRDAVAALDAARRAAHEPPLVTAHDFLLYRCDGLAREPAAPGRLRAAEAEDRELCLDWMHAFLLETGMAPPDAPRPSAFPHLDARRALLWEQDGRPVASACWGRATPTTAAVGFVYVPPAERGRGLAAAVTAGVTRLLLGAHGKRFTTLFTDAANPVANHLYPTLGYRRVAAFREARLG